LSHNHPPSTELNGHSICRRLKTDEIETVVSLSECGVGVSQILNVIKKEFNNELSSRQEIHNALAAARLKMLNGLSPIQKLLELLHEGSYKFSYEVNHNGAIKSLFFSHLKSIELSNQFGNVFVADCTYKTNRFGMPLLNIVGVTSTYHSFNAGFVFMSEEVEENYTWAFEKFRQCLVSNPKVISTDRELALMNAIASVFPSTKNILCVWHVEKNILANCRKYFRADEDWNSFISSWNTYINSKTVELCDENWNNFYNTFYESHSLAVSYIKNEWLPRKSMLVRAYTDRFLHLGSRTTSRGEGNHFCIKRYVNLAKCDLLNVFSRLSLMLENQFCDLKKYSEEEKLKVYHKHNIPLFSLIVRKISTYALDKLFEQFQNLKESSQSMCSSGFSSSFGLPCSHQIERYAFNNEPIPLATVNSQWVLTPETIENLPLIKNLVGSEFSPKVKAIFAFTNRLNQLPNYQMENIAENVDKIIHNMIKQVENPTVVKKRGRPVGAKNKSIKRDKSLFEIVEDNLSGRKCKLCGEGGHNSRTCPNKAGPS